MSRALALALALIALTSPAVADGICLDKNGNIVDHECAPWEISGWLECNDQTTQVGLDISKCATHGGVHSGHSPTYPTVTMSTNGEFRPNAMTIQGSIAEVPKHCNQGWVLIGVATSKDGPEVKKCAPAGALVDPQ